MAKKKEVQEAASAAVKKNFNLGNFKKKKGFSEPVLVKIYENSTAPHF